MTLAKWSRLAVARLNPIRRSRNIWTRPRRHFFKKGAYFLGCTKASARWSKRIARSFAKVNSISSRYLRRGLRTSSRRREPHSPNIRRESWNVSWMKLYFASTPTRRGKKPPRTRSTLFFNTIWLFASSKCRRARILIRWFDAMGKRISKSVSPPRAIFSIIGSCGKWRMSI